MKEYKSKVDNEELTMVPDTSIQDMMEKLRLLLEAPRDINNVKSKVDTIEFSIDPDMSIQDSLEELQLLFGATKDIHNGKPITTSAYYKNRHVTKYIAEKLSFKLHKNSPSYCNILVYGGSNLIFISLVGLNQYYEDDEIDTFPEAEDVIELFLDLCPTLTITKLDLCVDYAISMASFLSHKVKLNKLNGQHWYIKKNSEIETIYFQKKGSQKYNQYYAYSKTCKNSLGTNITRLEFSHSKKFIIDSLEELRNKVKTLRKSFIDYIEWLKKP